LAIQLDGKIVTAGLAKTSLTGRDWAKITCTFISNRVTWLREAHRISGECSRET